MALSANDAVQLVGDKLSSQWRTERDKLDRIDRWARWDHDDPHRPRQATAEYRELSKRAQAPWGDLIVTSVAQTLYVEGYKRPDVPDDSTGWGIWQANGMDARQVAIHRSVLTYGVTYGLCLPGKTLTGAPMPMMRGVSPREMLAVYEDPAWDEWPAYAVRFRPRAGGSFLVEVYDESQVHRLTLPAMGDRPLHDGVQEHGVGVCPVVRYTNRFDLEGRAAGEIEPFIPVLGAIDQTKFDRLVVQRFASWIVRTIAGMSVSETAKALGTSVDEAKMRLKVDDLLVADDPDSRFGSLPATPLDGFIKAHDSDLTDLAATSQTPAYELLGQMANLSAEALAAAKSSQTAKSDERKHTFGEVHEQFVRLACHVAGDPEGANDFTSQVQWADTSVRSLAQAADALGKLATMLGIPVEVLWPKVPGMTQLDIQEAKKIAAERGGVDKLFQEILAGQTSATPPAPVA